MRRLYRKSLFASLALSSIAAAAHAHAIVVSARPSQHETLAGPDVSVHLRFNSRVDARRSKLVLITPQGAQRPLAIRELTERDALSSDAKGLESGSYVLRWQVLAGDGHITRGEIAFTVK